MNAPAPAAPPADPAAAFDRAAGPALAGLNAARAAEILAVRPNPAVVARIEELPGRTNEGAPTDAERAELTAHADADAFVSVLQAHTERRLAAVGPAAA